MSPTTVRLLAVCVCASLSFCAAAAAPVRPQIFAPGVISGPAAEDSAAFTPDGDTVFFDRVRWPNAAILVAHRTAYGWSTPEVAPFSGRWLDHDPAMAPDGSFVIFSSNRPDRPGGKALDAVLADGKVAAGSGGHLWRVDRKGSGWGEPVRLPDTVNASSRTYAPSIAADGSVYFQRPGADGDFRLFRSQYRGGSYQPPVEVALGDGGAHKLDPAVAPDESFLVFDANYAGKDAPDRLYIAFREGNRWGAPIDLGDEVNHGSPWASHLGPDHRTLYFSSARGIPVHYPRTAAQGRQDMARMAAWDNGLDNLWSIPLAPWVDAHIAQTR
ncbi:TolB family protein [Frateuria terrea]|uniref:WD40-like Beta Propeller Repeat n=1 Tax=Frateuria terrea TaxID=529704 RepID=A0A1H6UCQ8_9GAMM|nr:PD40 domain-containing protein [Frateuria terrea]SEI85985.1 WD40-like Beta Propeller Repeat [Frateuria terrea]SFP39087.1 WD40-like Beta Propeller Repeat [Frateuria terrea]